MTNMEFLILILIFLTFFFFLGRATVKKHNVFNSKLTENKVQVLGDKNSSILIISLIEANEFKFTIGYAYLASVDKFMFNNTYISKEYLIIDVLEKIKYFSKEEKLIITKEIETHLREYYAETY